VAPRPGQASLKPPESNQQGHPVKDAASRDIPPQRGRRIIVTGATSGLGLQTAMALASAGAEVVLTGRNAGKGATSLATILAVHPQANIRYADLNLASLAAVSQFVARFSQASDSLDVLINNAGVMFPPTRHLTQDGFELQFGTNYLGHFALTAQLLPLLRKARQPRVVNLSSLVHRHGGAIHFDDLEWERSYNPWKAYSQSKLAVLLFTFELQRRSDAGGWGLMSTAAHPGYSSTGLTSSGPNMGRTSPSVVERLSGLFAPLFAQSAAHGALPTLFAATSAAAQPGGYYGPQGVFEMKGPVGPARIGTEALDQQVAGRLWKVAEKLTGAHWPA
jgi:NAD(P)-dependent dehydrogenase (short-subunit alcohol dehydrogenase family)